MKQTTHMSEASSRMVDLSQIINISAGDNLFILEMIDMYLNLLNKELEKIYSAAENGDTAALKSLIHKIKPNLKIFGLINMANVLIELEEEAIAGVLHPQIDEKILQVKNMNLIVLKELNDVRQNFDVNG